MTYLLVRNGIVQEHEGALDLKFMQKFVGRLGERAIIDVGYYYFMNPKIAVIFDDEFLIKGLELCCCVKRIEAQNAQVFRGNCIVAKQQRGDLIGLNESEKQEVLNELKVFKGEMKNSKKVQLKTARDFLSNEVFELDKELLRFAK